MPEPLPEPQVRTDIQWLGDDLLINIAQDERSIDLVMTPARAIYLAEELIGWARRGPDEGDLT